MTPVICIVSTWLHVVVLWGYVFCGIYHWGIDKFFWDYEFVQSELLLKAILSLFQVKIFQNVIPWLSFK